MEQTDRQFYRAGAQLSVRYGPETPEGRQEMALDREVWDTGSQLEMIARPILDGEYQLDSGGQLLPVLRWLDFKLDLVLYHQRNANLKFRLPHRAHSVDISGSGLGLDSFQGLETDRRVLLSILLPDSPWRPVLAVGRVVRLSEPPDDLGARAAIEFVEIAEADRERIIRFTFSKQRQELAQRMAKE